MLERDLYRIGTNGEFSHCTVSISVLYTRLIFVVLVLYFSILMGDGLFVFLTAFSVVMCSGSVSHEADTVCRFRRGYVESGILEVSRVVTCSKFCIASFASVFFGLLYFIRDRFFLLSFGETWIWNLSVLLCYLCVLKVFGDYLCYMLHFDVVFRRVIRSVLFHGFVVFRFFSAGCFSVLSYFSVVVVFCSAWFSNFARLVFQTSVSVDEDREEVDEISIGSDFMVELRGVLEKKGYLKKDIDTRLDLCVDCGGSCVLELLQKDDVCVRCGCPFVCSVSRGCPDCQISWLSDKRASGYGTDGSILFGSILAERRKKDRVFYNDGGTLSFGFGSGKGILGMSVGRQVLFSLVVVMCFCSVSAYRANRQTFWGGSVLDNVSSSVSTAGVDGAAYYYDGISIAGSCIYRTYSFVFTGNCFPFYLFCPADHDLELMSVGGTTLDLVFVKVVTSGHDEYIRMDFGTDEDFYLLLFCDEDVCIVKKDGRHYLLVYVKGASEGDDNFYLEISLYYLEGFMLILLLLVVLCIFTLPYFGGILLRVVSRTFCVLFYVTMLILVLYTLTFVVVLTFVIVRL